MEETNRKRPRDEVEAVIRAEEEEGAHKKSREQEDQGEQGGPQEVSLHDILSFLESEEDEPTNPNLSSLITSLQQELSSSSSASSPAHSEPSQQARTELDQTQLDQPDPLSLLDTPQPQEVMRYLLEASDDELGIPPSPIDPSHLEEAYQQSSLEREEIGQLDFEEQGLDLGLETESLSYDGWWEMDDQAANYYDLLHSQLCYDDGKNRNLKKYSDP